MECTDFIVSTSTKDKKHTSHSHISTPGTSTIAFLMDLANYMERNIHVTGDLMLLGDFNIHVNSTKSTDTTNF